MSRSAEAYLDDGRLVTAPAAGERNVGPATPVLLEDLPIGYALVNHGAYHVGHR